MKPNYYISLGIAACTMLFSQLQAQTQHKDTTLNRTVTVEQEYAPEILDASKVNVLPKVEEPTVSKKKVEYATTLLPAISIPGSPMQPYMGKEVERTATPGYVRAGYGSYGNLDLLANYLFRLSDTDKLNVRFQMDGMNGKLDNIPYPNSEATKWNAFYYRTRANVDYTHQFDRMDLNIGGNFGLSNFNYKPESINNKQKFTSGDVYAGIMSGDEAAPLQFNAEANLLFYERQHNLLNENQKNSLKETILRLQGDVRGAISDEQRITLALLLNNYGYGGKTTNAETGDKYLKSYTAIGLNPYYELNSDDWKIHLGAHTDFSFGFDKSIRVSPDITAQYLFSDSYILYAQATGGKLFNDFRRAEEISPYSELPGVADPLSSVTPYEYVQRPYDTYEQINGSIGFKASPYPGLWFNIQGGYQNLKNDLSCGIVEASIPTTVTHYLNFMQGNTNNVYAGGNISYDYKEYLSLAAKYMYRSWDAKDEYRSLLISKPESEFTFDVYVRPMPALSLNLGYNYTSRKSETDFVKMAAISNLYAGATYKFYKGVSIYAKINNLLNKDYQYYLYYPTEGLNFLGGLSFNF